MNQVLPPNNIDAENALLGAIMIDGDLIGDVLEIVPGQKCFFNVKNGQIFTTYCELYKLNTPIDFLSVATRYKSLFGAEDDNIEKMLIDLINEVPTSVNWATYAKLVSEFHLRRTMLAAASTAASIIYDTNIPLIEVISRVQNGIMSAVDGNEVRIQARSMKDLVGEHIDFIQSVSDRSLVVPTGFSQIDRSGVVYPSDFIILAARPGMGKTQIALLMAKHAAKHGRKVAFFSREMSGQQLLHRLVQTETGISVEDIRGKRIPEDKKNIWMECLGRLSEYPLTVSDVAGMSVATVRNVCRRLHATEGLDLVVIDYLQLLNPERATGNTNTDVSAISKALKDLARELDVPVIALAQLSRAVESRQNKRPLLSDLRDSGSIEQDADVVFFIYRDDYYNKEFSDQPEIVEVINEKKRHGGILPTMFYRFNKVTGTYTEQQMTSTKL